MLERMKQNPLGWRMEQLETIAKRYAINVRKTGGSHVVFDHASWVELLTVPARRPIKPIYIKRYLSLIENMEVVK